MRDIYGVGTPPQGNGTPSQSGGGGKAAAIVLGVLAAIGAGAAIYAGTRSSPPANIGRLRGRPCTPCRGR